MIKTEKGTYSDRIVDGIFGKTMDAALVESLAGFLETEVSENKLKPYFKAMEELGFTQFDQLKDHHRKMVKLGYDKKTLEIYLMYRLKYPLSRPFTDIIRDQICEKYDLVIGDPKDYIGPIPEWAMKQILQTKIAKEHMIFVPKNVKEDEAGLRYNYDGVPYSNGSNKEARKIKANMDGAIINRIPIKIKGREWIPAKLLIMAPLSAFNTEEKMVSNHFLVNLSYNDIRNSIKGMDFLEVIKFFEKINYPGKTITPIEDAKKCFNIRSFMLNKKMDYKARVKYISENIILLPDDRTLEQYVLETTPPGILRDKFERFENFKSFIETNPQLVPKNNEMNMWIRGIWDPIIFLPVKEGNLAFVAFGAEEAYEPDIYQDNN